MMDTPLHIDAVTLHEVFATLTDAGFTDDQALRLLGYMLAAKGTNGDHPGEGH